MALGPDRAQGWLRLIFPVLQQAGPALSLALLLALALSLWWLTGWMHTCVERNHALTERLITQQQTFMQELRLALAQCHPER